MPRPYVGRFAPSPTGWLHAGSLVAALASWLDARAHGGRWLVRIEDVDTPRCVPSADTHILRQLADCGLHPDAAPTWQSQRGPVYQQALAQLLTAGLAYPCACSRKEIALATPPAPASASAPGPTRARGAERVYPGTCRPENGGLHGRPARAWRLHTGMAHSAQHPAHAAAPAAGAPAIAPADARIDWHDRRLGAQRQDVTREVGDFVLRRADGLWAYQLAVVVDDAAQGITQVVRGEDLADNTARQILLQQALGLPTPGYLHTPLVRAPDGEKLSKQNGATPVDTGEPLAALNAAAQCLALPAAPAGQAPADALANWIPAWAARWALR